MVFRSTQTLYLMPARYPILTGFQNYGGLTGKDQPVIDFLKEQALVTELFQDIADFLTRWLPRLMPKGVVI